VGIPYYGSWGDPCVIYAGSPEVTMPSNAMTPVVMG
jgi:hypothetical protein